MKYNGKYSLTTRLISENLTGNARAAVGTRAENIIRVHNGLPVTERHSAAGRPDVPLPGGEVEAKSIMGKGTKYVKVEVFNMENPPTSPDRLAQYLQENPKIYGVIENGDVYDITGALRPTKSGRMSSFGGGGRMGHAYRVDMKSAELVHKASACEHKALIADLLAGVLPKEAAEAHGYPTLGDA